ncbi:CIA30 family protein [Leptolyngbya sp. FACHB-261]|uniref:CIA30 family protein n=1 Tax=Leptolyngbya sp. FACHB-261 TaxID=2692806 RepID=UPI001688468D|nr:CIA30 family protein [Leptolyngbya sp. FACHB-261]MBD2099835.1 CIA30 family protein [Leptolyngbya sp. FACHB-261]
MNQKYAARWDLARFWQTLTYFQVIPFMTSLQQWFGTQAEQPQGKDSVILVVGDNELGKSVAQHLVARGYSVRALVRDPDRSQSSWGNSVELVAGDITHAQTLVPSLLANIQATICCLESAEHLAETDITDSSNTAANLQSWKNLVQALAQNQGLVFDFREPSSDLKEIWGALDDVVMGGVSQSTIRLQEKTALFSGYVSTDNSGGFASIRTRNFDPAFDFSNYEGLELRLKGDGKRYKFMLRSEARWDGTAYCYSFDTVDGTWMSVAVPFAAMQPVFRAKTVPNAEPLSSSQVRSFQIMLSKFEYDGALNPKFAPGPFQLEIESVRAYGEVNLPQLVLVSSAPTQAALDREDIVRTSGLTYTIIRPGSLTSTTGEQPLVFEQTKQTDHNSQGPTRYEDLAEVCVQALSQPKACNVTFTVKGSLSRTDSLETGSVDWAGLFSRLKPDSAVNS